MTPNGVIMPQWVNSLLPREPDYHFTAIIFQYISVIDNKSITLKNILWYIYNDLFVDKSTLDEVMAWCHQVIILHQVIIWWVDMFKTEQTWPI